jgi:hypothetical protein
MAEKKDDKRGLAIGGGLFLGLGVGFFFLRDNVFAFLAFTMIGLGFGLMLGSMIKNKK